MDMFWSGSPWSLSLRGLLSFEFWCSSCKGRQVVLNSFYEGLPNTLIDAVNYEVPCISTDVSGARDILLNGKGGHIIPINNQHKLEQKIKYVMKNYPESKKKAKYAKSRIKRFGKINLQVFYKTFIKLVNYKKWT